MSREVMQQALEALESIEWHGAGACWVLDDEMVESAHDALRERLNLSEYDLWKQHPYTKAFMKSLEIERGNPFVTSLLGE